MRRRNLILILGPLVVAAMGIAHAQQSGKVYRIAFVDPTTADWLTQTRRYPFPPAFFSELRRWGYVEGKNILIERYSGLLQRS
jgi:putative ABC transport system substrate-binding protein